MTNGWVGLCFGCLRWCCKRRPSDPGGIFSSSTAPLENEEYAVAVFVVVSQCGKEPKNSESKKNKIKQVKFSLICLTQFHKSEGSILALVVH